MCINFTTISINILYIKTWRGHPGPSNGWAPVSWVAWPSPSFAVPDVHDCGCIGCCGCCGSLEIHFICGIQWTYWLRKHICFRLCFFQKALQATTAQRGRKPKRSDRHILSDANDIEALSLVQWHIQNPHDLEWACDLNQADESCNKCLNLSHLLFWGSKYWSAIKTLCLIRYAGLTARSPLMNLLKAACWNHWSKEQIQVSCVDLQ